MRVSNGPLPDRWALIPTIDELVANEIPVETSLVPIKQSSPAPAEPAKPRWSESGIPGIVILDRNDQEFSVVPECPWRTVGVGEGFMIPIYGRQDYLVIANRSSAKAGYENKFLGGVRFTQELTDDFKHLQVMRIK